MFFIEYPTNYREDGLYHLKFIKFVVKRGKYYVRLRSKNGVAQLKISEKLYHFYRDRLKKDNTYVVSVKDYTIKDILYNTYTKKILSSK